MPHIAKRCPNGYHINPKNNQCEPIKEITEHADTPKEEKPKGSKCPDGKHKHKGANFCHPISDPHKTNPEARKWHKEHNIDAKSEPKYVPPVPKQAPKTQPKRTTADDYGYSNREYSIKENKDTEAIITYDTGEKVFDDIINTDRKDALESLGKRIVSASSLANKAAYKIAFEMAVKIDGHTEEEARKILGDEPDVKYVTIQDTYNAIGMLKSNKNSNPRDALDDAIGNLVSITKSVSAVNPAHTENIVRSLSDVITLCPYALQGLTFIRCGKANGVMYYNEATHEICFDNAKFGHKTLKVQTETAIDPLTKESVEWKFNYGDDFSNAIAHEYGHLAARMIVRLMLARRDGKTDSAEVYAAACNDFNPFRTGVNVQEEYHNLVVDIISECKSLYKEQYGEFKPSDVWSGYGFSGRSSYSSRDDKDALMNEMSERCSERIAEAFLDVSYRKDKANTMSKMIVANVNHRIESLILGKDADFSKLFTDSVKRNGKPELIIKFIPFAELSRIYRK